MGLHAVTILARLRRDIHAIDPPGEVREVVGTHHGGVVHSIMELEAGLLWSREMLETGK
jgi:hypothetical protein